MSNFKSKLSSPTERQRFRQAVSALPGIDWQRKDEQYCDYRLDGKASSGWCRVKQFTNGTLYLEASTDTLLSQLTSLLNGGTPAKSIKPAPTLAAIRIGTDESGKGDYFGPLVVAGVLTTPETDQALRALGVTDSKALSAARIDQLAARIPDVVGKAHTCVIALMPEQYNAIYEKFRGRNQKLNHMLAYVHAQAVETLLPQAPEGAVTAIADQFGDARHLEGLLLQQARSLTLHQQPRAESDFACVAAASILARHQFVKRMGELSERAGVTLPLGAGPPVLAVARRLPKDQLPWLAKLHFKTTDQL